MLHVAVGVVRNALNQILIARRAGHQHQGGCWEFPGGKVEKGEGVEAALTRELQEELGITPVHAKPLITIPHHYADRSVLLDVWEVTDFSGEPQGREGQPLKWAAVEDLGLYEFPAANKAIVDAIELPRCIALSGSFSSVPDFLDRTTAARANGASALLFRMTEEAVASGFNAEELLRHASGLKLAVLMHSKTLRRLDISLDQVSGLHLDNQALDGFTSRPPNLKWLGASCHNLHQLQRAQSVGCDYAFLSPVKATLSHPDHAPLGWAAFANMVSEVALPVYALGGMAPVDIDEARGYGAQGVCCLSSCWGKP